ncbi:leucine-rich repeat-containing protein 46 isoform X1 [Aquila chrysaetos chrysaetos]|uniref:leucine-rich repeat-containing protein 46 isoform X1 n=1 Tax=Aquila chrysaetos chrysaetos TaxID=223781 RepID=UPI001177271D|nr:leucine-rich repeat-containing protein 46 isoform X1 [Aquila chrysaetos chrysaetos]
MVPPGPGVSLPHLGVPALIPPSPAVPSPPTPPARRFLPPIASAPFPLQRAVGSAQPPRHTHPRAQGRDKDPGQPPAMAGQGETLPGGREKTSLGVTLTDSLIAMRNLPRLVEPLHPESRSTELLSPSTVRLDRENICAIGRLQSLWEIHSLYLQQNQIEKIENLGCFPNLRYGQLLLPRRSLSMVRGEWGSLLPLAEPGEVRVAAPDSLVLLALTLGAVASPPPHTAALPVLCRFLSLAGNRIRRVENLQTLRHLRVLDLSHNQIQTLDPDELPRSLRLLDLTGNECTHQDGYRELVVGALPHLLQLDAQHVRGGVGEEKEEGGSSSSEDEDDELLSEPSGPFTAGKDFFADLHRELAGRSRRRRREALEEHQTRLEELEELQECRGLLLPPAPLSPGREGAACITTPGPRWSQPRPQAKLGTQLPPLPGPGGQHACPQPQRPPGGSQPRTKALEEETRAKGAKNRQLPRILRTSMAPHGWD